MGHENSNVDPRPWTGASAEPETVDVREYLAIIHRRRWVMLAIIAAVMSLGMLYTLTRRPVYESSAKIVVVTSSQGIPVAQNDLPILSDLQALTRSRSVDTQVEIISGADLLEDAYRSLSPSMRKRGFESSALPSWAFTVAGKKSTDLIVVTTRAYRPEAAAALANTIADTYFKRDLRQNNLATRQARAYAGRKMVLAEQQLAKANASLSEFKSRTGLFAPDTQLTKAAEQMAQLSMEFLAATADAKAGEHEVAALRSQLTREAGNVVSGTTITRNPQFTAILDKVEALTSQRAELIQEYTPQSREIRRLDNQIVSERARLKHVAENLVSSVARARNPVKDTLLTAYATGVASYASKVARARSIQGELSAGRQAAKSLPEGERQYTELVQRASMLQRTYEMLFTKYYTLMLSEQSTLPTGMLVSRARVASSPAYPNPMRNASIFILMGTLLAVVGAIMAERFDYRLHDQNTAEQLSGLAVLAAVPDVKDEDCLLIGETARRGALLESFRILRSNIAFAGVGKAQKVFAVASPGRDEGKSTVAVNLAIALGMEGKRVLIVDADLRRPTMHRVFGATRKAGLTTILTGETKLEDAIVRTESENVFCVPSGPSPPNPSELLGSAPSRELFARFVSMFDVVLVDCPPVAGLSDVQVISTLVDGVLLVVSMGRTSKPHLQMTARTLSQSGAPAIGLVLNRADARRRGYGYYYYSSSYYDDVEASDNDSSVVHGRRGR